MLGAQCGNADFELRKNRLGGPLALKTLLTKYTRRGLA
jgi:capsid portal protein